MKIQTLLENASGIDARQEMVKLKRFLMNTGQGRGINEARRAVDIAIENDLLNTKEGEALASTIHDRYELEDPIFYYAIQRLTETGQRWYQMEIYVGNLLDEAVKSGTKDVIKYRIAKVYYAYVQKLKPMVAHRVETQFNKIAVSTKQNYREF